MTLHLCQKITLRRRERKEMSGFSLVNSCDSVLQVRRLQTRKLCSLPAYSLEMGEKFSISVFFTLIWEVANQLGNSSVTQHVTDTEQMLHFTLFVWGFFACITVFFKCLGKKSYFSRFWTKPYRIKNLLIIHFLFICFRCWHTNTIYCMDFEKRWPSACDKFCLETMRR